MKRNPLQNSQYKNSALTETAKALLKINYTYLHSMFFEFFPNKGTCANNGR